MLPAEHETSNALVGLWSGERSAMRTKERDTAQPERALLKESTAARRMDIISRLPGCAGQAADAVSAYTQVYDSSILPCTSELLKRQEERRSSMAKRSLECNGCPKRSMETQEDSFVIRW